MPTRVELGLETVTCSQPIPTEADTEASQRNGGLFRNHRSFCGKALTISSDLLCFPLLFVFLPILTPSNRSVCV